MSMRRKIKFFIFASIFCLFFANSFPVRGIEVTYSFIEVGSIASNSSIISVDCLENELAFLAEINRGLVVYNVTNPSSCTELDYSSLSFV
ncbi:MAG: hypothetical protein ACFFDS_03465, partial [Candidatus Thorarchaeota archaeon]